MRLYGHFISLTTLQVMSLLAEKNAAADFILVDVEAGEQKRPAHRALHPWGHIPVFEDGDFRLYETHAILRYIDRHLPGPSLIPSEVRAQARMDQWLCIEQNYLLPAAKKVMARGYAQMMSLPDPGPAIVEEGHRELAFAFDLFANRMAAHRFIAGDSFSLADLCWRADLLKMATGEEARWIEDERIRPWWERVTERPAWPRAQAELAARKPPAS